MNCGKDFRFDFLGALKCLYDCDDGMKNELAQFIEVKVCTIQASNDTQLFTVKLIFVYGEKFIKLWDIFLTLILPFRMSSTLIFFLFFRAGLFRRSKTYCRS